MNALVYGYLYLLNQLNNEDGQDLAEYMLLVALIAVVVIGAISLLGGQVRSFFDYSIDMIAKAVPTTL